ncbi:MAG: peptidoglycan-binding protein [Microcoleaceae cyanobacterium]
MSIKATVIAGCLSLLLPGVSTRVMAAGDAVTPEEVPSEYGEELGLSDILIPAEKSVRLFQPRFRAQPYPESESSESSLFSNPYYEGSEPRRIRMRVLERGNQGYQVQRLQQRLIAHGFSPGRIDSVFGDRTEQSVRAFQAAMGLEVTGLADHPTWEILNRYPQALAAQENSEKETDLSGVETFPSSESSRSEALNSDSSTSDSSSSDWNDSGLQEPASDSSDSPITSRFRLPDSDTLNSGSNNVETEVKTEVEARTEVILQRGDRGSRVRVLQTRLQVQGYDPGKVDGIFGPRTQAAVIAYQESKGLDSDGRVDEMTWFRLGWE